MEEISTIAQVLKATGPYGLVSVIGWALWRVNERKDRELKSLYERVITLSEAQTTAMVKVESALVALRDAIKDMRQR